MIDLFRQQYLILILVFALAHFTRQIMLYLRLWQIKQHRWDRLWDSLREDYRILLPKSSFSAFVTLASFFFVPYSYFLVLTTINFIFWGGYALIQGVRRHWVYPRPTAKGKVFFVTLWLLLILIEGGLFIWWTSDLPFLILAMAIVWPLVLMLSLLIMEQPVNIVKKRLMTKAFDYRNRLKELTVIGITGSFGKTSVKEFLYHFLSLKYGTDQVLKTDQNINTQLGIAETILNKLTNQHRFFICEMGAYRMGEISKSAQLAQPQLGILTGINDQHLSLFGSLENIIKAKYELVKALPPQGTAVFNGDNQLCLNLYHQTTGRKMLISTQKSDLAKWRAESIEVEKDRLRFKMFDQSQQILIEARLIGRSNIINLLLSGSVALELGLSLKDLAQFAKTLPTPAGGARIIPYHQGSIINASYSSNPDGARAHLEHLQLWSGRRAIITPGFIELGKVSAEAHYQLGKQIGRTCDRAILTHKRYHDEIKQGIKEANGQTELFLISQPEEIINQLQGYNQSEDVILIEGRIDDKIISLLQGR
jgi:UDP-N-acetylmuramoyl-tripeptide--D-alanyl-D-alanine ligase